MPSRFLALPLFLLLLTGCTISADARSAPPTATPEPQIAAPLNVVEAARFHLESSYGPERFARLVTSIGTVNSVLVVTMVEEPASLANVDEYWRVCRTLARTLTVPGIAPGQTALVVIQPNGTNVVYAVAGEAACKVA